MPKARQHIAATIALLIILIALGPLTAASTESAESPATTEPARRACSTEPAEPGTQGRPTIPMSLQDCIDYGLAHSPELNRRKLDHTNQQLNTDIERAVFDLQLRADTAYDVEGDIDTHSVTLSRDLEWGMEVSTSVSVEDETGRGDMTGDYSVTLSKTIIGGGTTLETMSRINTSLYEELIRRNDLHKSRRDLVFQVRRRWYDIISKTQTLRVQQLILANAERNLEHAIVRDEPLDIETARIEVPAKQTAVLRARRQIDTALSELQVLIGIRADEPFDIDAEFEFATAPIDTNADIAYALENQEDILNNALRAKIFQLDADVQQTHLWPELSVLVRHNQDSSEDVDFGGNASQNIGVSLSWELGLRADRARYGRARNIIRKQQWTDFQTRQEKIRIIIDLARELAELTQSIDLQKQRIEVGKRLVELYRDRYDNGEIGILEMIRSQNDDEQNSIELIDLETSYMALLARYHFEVGK